MLYIILAKPVPEVRENSAKGLERQYVSNLTVEFLLDTKYLSQVLSCFLVIPPGKGRYSALKLSTKFSVSQSSQFSVYDQCDSQLKVIYSNKINK